MPDEAYKNVLVGFIFTGLCFGTMLQLTARIHEHPPLFWLELGLGLAILVAIDWILIRLYRQVRRLQARASHERGA